MGKQSEAGSSSVWSSCSAKVFIFILLLWSSWSSLHSLQSGLLGRGSFSFSCSPPERLSGFRWPQMCADSAVVYARLSLKAQDVLQQANTAHIINWGIQISVYHLLFKSQFPTSSEALYSIWIKKQLVSHKVEDRKTQHRVQFNMNYFHETPHQCEGLLWHLPAGARGWEGKTFIWDPQLRRWTQGVEKLVHVIEAYNNPLKTCAHTSPFHSLYPNKSLLLVKGILDLSQSRFFEVSLAALQTQELLQQFSIALPKKLGLTKSASKIKRSRLLLQSTSPDQKGPH